MTGADDLSDAARLLAQFDAAAELRAERESHRRELEGLLNEVLDVADQIEDLAAHCAALAREADTAVPSPQVDLLRRRLWMALERVGVLPMNAAGAPLDLEQHEVLETRSPLDGEEEDTVVREVVRGWTWRGRPLRRAKVVLAGRVEVDREEGQEEDK